MARDETIKCDASGCRKTPLRNADHVYVTVQHRVGADALPDGVENVSPVLVASYDFCSYEHAAKTLGGLEKETAGERKRLIAFADPARNPDAEASKEEAESG